MVIFVATLSLILWRPKGIREVWFAASGAVCALLLGSVAWTDVVQLLTETGPVLAFLAGMLVVGFVADQAGVFVWLARHIARMSRGSGRRLFVGLYLAGVFVTVWFSLDTTAVILAPIVYTLVRSLGIPALPFVMATTYVANTASLLLPVSNLTNLIVWNRFQIPFWRYAAVMALPALAAIIINLILFLGLFRKDIPRRFSPDGLASLTIDSGTDVLGGVGEAGERRLVRCLAALTGILVGIGVAPFLGWELWIVAVVGGAVLAGQEIIGGRLKPWQLVTGISWDLLPFVFSLFLILRAVGQSGLTDVVQSVLVDPESGDSLGRLLFIAATSALGSNLINNLPMVLVAVDSLAVPVFTGQIGMSSVYAALLGTNLGPNLTVIGSLATMLSLSIIEGRGLRVPGLLYLKIGLVTVPLLLLGSVASLWLTMKL